VGQERNRHAGRNQVLGKVKRKIRALNETAKIYADLYLGPRDIVKIHGTLRVGSNYLQKLLENNFSARVLGSEELAWKHGKMTYCRSCKYIVISRNPFSWAISFWNWEKVHHRTDEQNLAAFLRAKVTHPKLKEEWGARNPIDAWNRSYENWQSFVDRPNVVFIRYEDLLEEFQSTMTRIGDTLDLQPLVEEFVDFKKRADNWKKPSEMGKLNVEFYKDKKFISSLDEESISYMRDNLKPELIAKLGYTDSVNRVAALLARIAPKT
jgi:hypothetical protein